VTNAQAATKIVRVSDPVNLEFPFETLSSDLTPTDAFYVRNHFSQPEINVQAWRLSIEGAVEKPLQLTFPELLSMPTHTVTSVLECAGNSRVFLSPKVAGAQWGLGAVGNAEWKGVLLSTILERACLAEDAVDVVFEGADKGVPDEQPKPCNPIYYARSIPKSKALEANILLAYEMNGAPLSEAHGFPLRLIVPGWYGMASVKWLQRIVVTEYPYDGYFQKIDYAFWEERDGLPVRQPITEIELKSQIAQPAAHSVIDANSTCLIYGAAWTGSSKIAKVEVSVDGGKEWHLANLGESDNPHAWIFWHYQWKTSATPHDTILMCRATDTEGRSQPLTRDLNKESYRISHTLPISVQVR